MRAPIYALSSTLLLFAVACMGSAQDRTPTADDVKGIKAKYEAERKEAVEQKFAPQSLELAEQLAKRAEVAAEGNSFKEAVRLYREARWQLPYLPPDLPKGVARVFGNTHMRHGDAVNQIAFAPDGKRLASASNDNTVKIWDLGNGREVLTHRAHKERVRSVAWSGDGKVIASAGGNEIHLWSPEDGKLRHALQGHTGAVNSVAFNKANSELVSASDDGSIRIWDVGKGKELQTVNAQQLQQAAANPIKTKPLVVYFAVFSPNGKLVASTNGDGLLQVWKPDMAPPQQKLVLGTNAHGRGAYQVLFSPDMRSLFTCGGESTARQHGGTDPEGQNISGTGVRQKNFDSAGGGHNDVVTAIALSPDGKTLVTGSRDKSIRVWDLNTAKVVRTLQGHTEEITSLAFSPDGTQLASASKDQNIRIWSLSSSDEHRNFAGHAGHVWSAVFSNDGKLFASAGADKTIIVRNAITGAVVHKIPAHNLAITALAFSSNGELLASAAGDQLVKLWNMSTGELVKELKGHTAAVMAIDFSHDGKQIISGGADKVARLWDVAKGETLHTFPDARSPISSVALRKDGKQAAIGCADGLTHFYDISGPPRQTNTTLAHLSGVGAVAYSPDGTRLATCGGDKLVKVWRVSENGAPAIATELKGHTQPVSSVAFSSDGRLLASGGGDMIVKVWDVQSGTELRSLRGHGDWVSSVVFGADPRYVLSASVDRNVKLWELSNEETAPPAGHTRRLNTLAVSPDGKWLASGSDDRTIKIWNTATGQEAFTLAEHTEGVKALAFDPSGDRLVSGGDDRKIRIWDLKTRKVLHTLDCEGTIVVIVFSQKGDKFFAWYFRPGATNGPQASTVQAYDLNGKPLYAFTEREKQVSCLSLTPDGEWAAMGSKDGSVRIWDIAKSERAVGGDMPVHQKEVGDLVFSPDKKRLITGDEDSDIKIWDLAKKEAIKTITAHQGRLLAVAMSPDGKRFATASGNELRLWNAENGTKLQEWVLPTPINNVIFSADSRSLITANGDTTLYVLTVPSEG